MPNYNSNKPAGSYIDDKERIPVENFLLKEEQIDNTKPKEDNRKYDYLTEEERHNLAEEIMNEVRIETKKCCLENEVEPKKKDKLFFVYHKKTIKEYLIKHQKNPINSSRAIVIGVVGDGRRQKMQEIMQMIEKQKESKKTVEFFVNKYPRQITAEQLQGEEEKTTIILPSDIEIIQK